MDELVKVVVDDSQSTDALNRIAAAGARADTSINNLGQTIDKTTQATRSASGAAASNATSVQNQASAFQRLQSIVAGAASSFQRLASTTSGTLGSAFSRLQTVAGNAFSAIIAYANNAGGALNNFNRNLQQNQRSMDNLWRLASATAAANIFGAMWDKATAGISAYIDRMTEVQRTMSMLTVVTPTGQQGEFDYIMKTADKYGVRLQSLANNYAKLAISAREANVPQETMRKLFEGTSIGARVMHMSVSQVDLTFQALTQMMSKGIVSTEELRRQFAERMPGAIHATAKELGVTYDELDKFIKKGKALSDKFIPYLANGLINSFGKGIGPAASALDAELNRIQNSFDKFFKQVYDEGGDKGPAAAIRALNEKLNNPEIAKSFARWVDSISKEVTRFIQLITMEDIEKGANTFITVLKAIGDMAIFAAKSVKWLSENLGIVGGLLGAYMGAKIGFMVGGPPGMAVGAAIGGLGGAVGGLAMGGAGTPGTQLQPSKANSQMLLENQLRLQASGSANGTQFNKADLDLLSGLPQTKTGDLPELLPLKKVGPGTTLDDLLGGATGGPKNGSGAGAKATAAAAERALEKQEDLMAKLHGLNKNFAEEWDTLNTVFNSAANKKQQFLPLEELISLQQELLEQQPFMKEIRKDEAISLKYQMKELDEYNKVQQNLLDDKKKMAEESMMDAQRMEDEAVAWQYAKDNAVDLATGIQMMAQARAQDNYESALAAGASGETLLALQKELEARNRILNQTKANDIRDTAEEEYRKLAKRQANFWDDVFQNVDRTGRSVFQSLAQGGDDAFKQIGETIKTSIIDVLYQMTAQKWMISIGTSFFGDGFAAAAARAGGGASGGSNLLGTALQGPSLYNGLTSGTGVLGSIGNAIGLGVGASTTMGGLSATAIGSYATPSVAAMTIAPGAAGAGGAGGAMSSIAAAGPLIAAAAAIHMIASSLDDSGTYHTGGAAQYSAATGLRTSLGFRDNEEGLPSYNPNDNIDNQFGTGFGYVERGDQTISAVSGIAQSLGTALDGVAVSFGQKAGYEIATAFADDTSKDGAWGALRISKDGQELLNWEDTRKSKWAPREFGDGEEGYKQYLAAVAKDTRQVLLDMDLPSWADTMLESIGDAANMDQLAATVQQIGVIQTTFVQLGKAMEGFAGLTDQAFEALMKASGGFEALSANAGTYYGNFYSEKERKDSARKQLAGELSKYGVDIDFDAPDARAQYRKQVEAAMAASKAQAANSQALQDSFTASLFDVSKDDLGKGAAGWDSEAVRNLIGSGTTASDEQRARITAAVTAIDTTGMSLDDFKGSVSDLIAPLFDTGKGASETAAALLDLNDEFAAVTQSAEEAAAAARQLAEEQARAVKDAVKDAYSALEKAIAREREAIEVQRSLAAESVDTLTDIFETIRSNVRELYSEVGSTAAMQVSQANAFIDNALRTAQTTGYMPDGAALSEAISTARSGLSSGAYTSQFEADRDRLVLAGKLSTLGEITGEQLTTAERQLKYSQEQIEQLDQTLDYWREQIDIANGTYQATLSVADAIGKLQALLFPDAQKPAATQPGGGASFGGGGGAAAAPPPPAKYNDLYFIGGATPGRQGVIDQERIAKLDALSPIYHSFDGTGDLVGLFAAIQAAGGTMADLSTLSGYWESDWRKAGASVGIPAFAVGTNYVPRDMLAQIHEGEAIIPKAYNPAANPGMGGGNSEVVSELRALREENRQQAGEIARLNLRMARVLEKFDGDGMPATRDEAVA